MRARCVSNGNLAVGENQWYDFGAGEFTTHLEPILVVGLNRLFTGGTIWILTHGHLVHVSIQTKMLKFESRRALSFCGAVVTCTLACSIERASCLVEPPQHLRP